jgi:sugar O-acyltransferase (sialic acid O-acetyltransferase NeuD family)
LRTLAILGAGGHGKVVADAAICAGWQEVVFFDEAYPGSKSIGPWAILGSSNAFMNRAGEFAGATVAIGENRTRQRWIEALQQRSVPISATSVAHPSSIVSQHATTGPGSVILAGAIVNAFARLGTGCIINSGATVDHDCDLADGVHISPGANLAGGVRVGKCTWIGIGAAIREGLTIGQNVIVGAGAAVTTDVQNGLTVVGVPAKPIVSRRTTAQK